MRIRRDLFKTKKVSITQTWYTGHFNVPDICCISNATGHNSLEDFGKVSRLTSSYRHCLYQQKVQGQPGVKHTWVCRRCPWESCNQDIYGEILPQWGWVSGEPGPGKNVGSNLQDIVVNLCVEYLPSQHGLKSLFFSSQSPPASARCSASAMWS